MKYFTFNQLFSILFLIILCSCTKPDSHNNLNVQQFKNPPSDYRVHTWWHWTGGIITREGITKDLESMKRQGISQATIFNIGASYNEDFGVKKVLFNTEEWYDMFEWALQEANRLGISIGVHNCDGWSTSGGPWITPEKAMKKFVFTKTKIRENQEKIKLPKPYTETGFYRDVAVVAFKKVADQSNSKQPALPENIVLNDSINAMMLVDGDPESKIEVKAGYVLDIDNPTKAVKTKIDIFQNYVGVFFYMKPPTVDYTLKASDDGVHFREIAKLKTKSFFEPEIFKIPATNASYFRLVVDNTHSLRPWHHMGLSELQLLSANEQPIYNPTIQNPLEKSSSVRVFNERTLHSINEKEKDADVISENNVIDITKKMQPDGTLNWTVPEGNWEIIRFGYTNAKAYNISSSKEGRGLEVDKMDTTALNFYFKNFPQKLIDKAGKFTGNTFKFLLVDSWESGYQTWTNSMENKFENLRGYNMIQWIPVLCGETVGSEEQSNGFLYDFRRTIADLLEQNFYKHYAKLCNRNNLKLHAEAIYGNNYPAPPIDDLKVNGLLDMPMTEFWAQINDESMVKYKPGKKGRPDFAVFAPNFFNIKSLGAEAYTGYAHYSESPNDLKLLGDRAFCSGVNQMVLHSYVLQPVEREPGFTLGDHGSHFNRHNPVWQFDKGWINYQSRIQYALQNSKISARILYYLGDQFPQFIANKTISSLPETYQSVPCNLDILNKLTVKDGKIRFSDTQEYSLLVLPDGKYLSFEALKQIERMVQQGAVIYGKKPLKMLSLFERKEKSKEFSALTEKMWSGYGENLPGRNKYGKGTIIWGEPIKQLLTELKIKPDFSTYMPDTENLMFIHRNTQDDDIFFVVNQTDSLLNRECLFNTSFNTPEIWDPMTGEIKKPAIYDLGEEGIRIPVTFYPEESLLFVFKKGNKREHVIRVSQEHKQIFPSKNGIYDASVPEVYFNSNGAFQYLSNQGGKYIFTTNNGTEQTKNFAAPKVREINDFEGKLILNHINSNQVDSVNITTLKSFTEFKQAKIKYFAGVATYQIDFKLPKSFTLSDKAVFLSLGKLDATAKVRFNGKSLGYVWTPDFKIPVEGLLKENNHLEIELGTTVRNRFIGDYIEYGKAKNVWSTADVTKYLNKKSVLKPTGVMGPMRLISYPLVK